MVFGWDPRGTFGGKLEDYIEFFDRMVDLHLLSQVRAALASVPGPTSMLVMWDGGVEDGTLSQAEAGSLLPHQSTLRRFEVQDRRSKTVWRAGPLDAHGNTRNAMQPYRGGEAVGGADHMRLDHVQRERQRQRLDVRGALGKMLLLQP